MSNILRAMSDGTPYNFIVKPYLSYDGSGVPVGGHGKVASQTEDRIAHATYIYTMYTYINISSFLILSMYVRSIKNSTKYFCNRFHRLIAIARLPRHGPASFELRSHLSFVRELRIFPRWSRLVPVH